MTEFKRVFVDTAPIIYYLENSSLYMDSIKKFFIKCIEENIQIASAIVSGCDMFFTNDKQLRQEKELPCMTMEDLEK